jgi:adenylylsulfate kinase
VSGAVVWITGLPSSGKSTLASRIAARVPGSVILDGDEVRRALVPQPGYSDADRDGFYRTLANLSALLAEEGLTVLVPATAHRRCWRARARDLTPRFLEVFVDVPAAECRRRDAKGLYAQDLPGLPGAGAIYEPPESADVVATGGDDSAAVDAVVRALGT